MGYLLGLARLLENRVSDAEDLVQETLVSVVKRWSRVCQASNPRRRNRLTLSPWPVEEHGLPGNAGGLDAVTDRAVLVDALGGLPPTRRAVIVLHFYAGMTADEIGHELHLKPSSVRSSLRRSLERLRRKGLAQSTGVTP